MPSQDYLPKGSSNATGFSNSVLERKIGVKKNSTSCKTPVEPEEELELRNFPEDV